MFSVSRQFFPSPFQCCGFVFSFLVCCHNIAHYLCFVLCVGFSCREWFCSLRVKYSIDYFELCVIIQILVTFYVLVIVNINVPFSILIVQLIFWCYVQTNRLASTRLTHVKKRCLCTYILILTIKFGVVYSRMLKYLERREK